MANKVSRRTKTKSTHHTTRRNKTAASAAFFKDGPFPKKKDGPFPLWIKVPGPQMGMGRDAPFPMESGLYFERIPFVTLYQGSPASGPKNKVTAVVHSAADLAARLPGMSFPSINWDEEEVILVQLGQRPSNGFLAQIDDILYLTDRGKGLDPLTSVSYSEHRSPGLLDVLTYPMHVVKLRKLDGTDVSFNQH